MIKLLPCPLCGEEAEFLRLGTRSRSCQIGCTECGCSMETSEVGEFCGDQWNHRVAIWIEISKYNSEEHGSKVDLWIVNVDGFRVPKCMYFTKWNDDPDHDWGDFVEGWVDFDLNPIGGDWGVITHFMVIPEGPTSAMHE